MTISSSTTWVFQPRPNPQASIRLFCFPYAGGSAAVFNGWGDTLPPAIAVCPIQYPGRGRRLAEAPHTAINTLADELLPAILPLLDRPCAFFGHSMGALVAFELARLLHATGRTPAHIFVSAHRAPQLPDPDPPLHALPDAELIEQLRLLNGTPPEVLSHAELLTLLLPILRADFAACETYRYIPGPPLICPLTAFGGLRDPHISRTMLEAWQAQTNGAFAVRMFPGDHFFLNTDRHALFAAIARDLNHHVSLNLAERGL